MGPKTRGADSAHFLLAGFCRQLLSHCESNQTASSSTVCSYLKELQNKVSFMCIMEKKAVKALMWGFVFLLGINAILIRVF